jgi:hypothetical protein
VELKRKAALAAAGLVMSFGGVMGGATTATAATCPDNGWSVRDPGYAAFNTNYVNIRTGPSTSCTAVGQGQNGQRVSLHCWKTGADGYAWDHIYNTVTGKSGWVRSSFLTGYGSSYHC